MPYIIVETIEKGAKKLSICPVGWVTNGILNWPEKKSSKKCKIDDLPPKQNWLQMQYIIKRANLLSYEDAEEELKEMLDLPETDTEGINKLKTKVLTDDFNDIAGRLSSNQFTEASDAGATVDHSSGEAINADAFENHIVVPATNHNVDDPIIEPAETMERLSYDNLLLNQKTLSENQMTIISNQFKIMKTLSTLSVKIDNYASRRENLPMPVTVVSELSRNMKKSPHHSKVTPIKSLNDLQHMENQLRDAETRIFYKNLYSVFCTPGKKGEVCAFQLIDVLFSREFLVQCSWSGSARGAGTKISMKLFQEVPSFFLKLVHDYDPSYTVDKNNSFFKSIVKNAFKRTQTKLERTSAPRKVPKRKLATKSKNKTVKKLKSTEEADATENKSVTVEVILNKFGNDNEVVMEEELIEKQNINEETNANLDVRSNNEKKDSNLDNNNVNEENDAGEEEDNLNKLEE